MNKRGSERKVIFLASMMMIALIIGLLMFRTVSNFLDDTTFWKLHYSRDLGLLMDIGQTGRGTMQLNYDLTQSNKPLTVILAENAIRIYDYNLQIQRQEPVSFRFAKDKNINVETTQLSSSYMKISFSEEKTSITKKPLEKKSCPNINTKSEPSQTKIYIQSNVPIIAALMKQELSEFIIVNNPEEADLTLIIDKSNEQGLTFYYLKQARKSEKLSCNIKNNLIDSETTQFELTTLQTTPEDSEFIETITKSTFSLTISTNELTNELIELIAKGVKEFYG
ncbi:MAG: hypothetical protein KKF89_05270 [Nanoarchaeota archaeon]|nr:hypothetical protein [Nanoarchaeota archaeon]MBU1855105.1 hypothetical protein [Nanoarchaeota archaeon]